MEWEELIPSAAGPPPDGRAGARAPAAASRACASASRRAARRCGRSSRRASSTASTSETWERLEEALILADVGAKATAEVVGRLEGEVEAGEVSGPEATQARLVELLAELAAPEPPTLDLSAKPTVIMVVGVNGTGKTTTIGKLAAVLKEQFGLQVIVAAADTYRAAAIEQLETWAERAGTEIVRGNAGGDPGAVVFDALAAAEARGADVVIVDTAGRLHTHGNLMEELAKVGRVAAQAARRRPARDPDRDRLDHRAERVAPGARVRRAVDVTGVVLTKLDGTAKGGIALAIAGELGIPVKLIGVGERLEDLRPFDAEAFAHALLDE